jgi:hypothetical protein
LPTKVESLAWKAAELPEEHFVELARFAELLISRSDSAEK